MTRLPRSEWLARRGEHQRRLTPWVTAHQSRSSRGEKHPVYDFLFSYYFFKPRWLLRWSPGVEVALEHAALEEIDWAEFEAAGDGMAIPSARFPKHRIASLEWAINYQQSILNREPNFACFGLHEWAMVYRSDSVRHSQVPLRLSPAEIDAVVESQGLRCSHYDAFRFFTPQAVPRNRISLTREAMPEHDQPACIHANMDLYKFAYRIAPFGSSELLADCFEFALKCREADMRASPYDLSSLGFEAIPIETREGREQYRRIQQELANEAGPLRLRILEEYARLLRFVTAR